MRDARATWSFTGSETRTGTEVHCPSPWGGAGEGGHPQGQTAGTSLRVIEAAGVRVVGAAPAGAAGTAGGALCRALLGVAGAAYAL